MGVGVVVVTGEQALVLIKLQVVVFNMEVDVVRRGTPEAGWGVVSGGRTGGGEVPTGDVVSCCGGRWAGLHFVALARL